MDNFSARIAGLLSGGAAAEAAAIAPQGTATSTGTQLTLYVADGLLEVLEWATDGQAADPPAAIWLALLRWYNNRYGAYPEGLPVPPERWIDQHPVSPGHVEEATTAGLEHPDMGLPRKPHGQDATGTDALVRAAPLGMLPQVEADWVVNMSRQVAVLTHGDWRTPTAYSLLIHHVLSGATLFQAVTHVLDWLAEDDDGAALAGLIRTGLGGGVDTPTTAQTVLAAALGSVADALAQPVAPEQLYASAVTRAVNCGGHTQATALVAGQVMGALLGDTGTNAVRHLDAAPVLQELIERWVKLTT